MKAKHILYMMAGILCLYPASLEAKETAEMAATTSQMTDGRADNILFQDLQQPNRIGIFATPSLAQAFYKVSSATQAGPRFEIGFGLDWEYRLTERWSIGLAIGMMRYRSEISFEDSYMEKAMQTPEAYDYFLCQTSNQTESFQTRLFELPLMFRYTFYESQSLSAFIGFGPSVGVKFSEQSDFISGYYERQAEFRDRDVIIDDFPELGFGRFDSYLNPESKSSYKVTFGGAVELGVRVPMADRWLFNAAAQAQMYGLYVGNKQHSYLESMRFSSTYTSDRVENRWFWGTGLRIGISFLF